MGWLTPTITLKMCVESYGMGQYVLRRFAEFEEPIIQVPDDPFSVFPSYLYDAIMNAGPFDIYPKEIPSGEPLYSCLTGLPVSHGELLLDKYQMDEIAIGQDLEYPSVIVLGDRAYYYDSDKSSWGEPIGGDFPNGDIFEGLALYPDMEDYIDTYYPSGLRYVIAEQGDDIGFTTGVGFGRYMTTSTPGAVSEIQMVAGNAFYIAPSSLGIYAAHEGEEPMVSLRNGLSDAGLSPFLWYDPPYKFCAADVLPAGFIPTGDENGDRPGIKRIFPPQAVLGINVAGLMSTVGLHPVGLGLKWRVLT